VRYFQAILSAALALVFSGALASAAAAGDPAKIDAYVTPYYNSAGPVVHVGQYSAGLAASDGQSFVDTIRQMKKHWMQLSFPQLYVAAIRLYDLGYRKESVYWFYTAQYRGRQFALLADQKKLGSIGNPGFELYHAQNAFFELTGPGINGYAFGDIDTLVTIVHRVQNENRTVPAMQSVYPGVAFAGEAQWPAINAQLNGGLGKLAESLVRQRSSIEQERQQNGTAARFSHVTDKPLPGGR
jgi:hypothetical protein